MTEEIGLWQEWGNNFKFYIFGMLVSFFVNNHNIPPHKQKHVLFVVI